MKSLPYTIALLFCGLIIVSMAAKGHSTDTDESVQKWEQLAYGAKFRMNIRALHFLIMLIWGVQR